MLKRTVVTLSLGLAVACTPPTPEPTNAAPSTPVVSISPSNPRTADTLKVSVVSPSVDLEGQPVTYGYQWLKDGAPQGDLVTDTVPADRTKKGEAWSVLVTPSDGKASGTAGTSAVTVGNTLPTATVALTPESPTAVTGLKAVPSGSDEDGDTVTFAYGWTRNGQSTLFVDASIPASEVKRGDTWKVTVTPTDGAAGEAVSASVTVGNALPMVASVTLEPAQPTKAAPLVAVPGAVTDADADIPALKHTWTVNGAEVAGQTAAALPSAHFKKGDAVTVTLRANDGTADGPAVSASTTVVNAVPALTGAAITPLSGGKGDTFTCAPLGWTDADGDTEGYTYEWKVGAQVVGTAASLAGSALTKGQSVTCTVTPTDGTASGTSQVSTAAMVVNTPPTLAAVTLSPANPVKADTLVATVTGYADVDGDAAGYQYTWRRDGAVIPGQEGPTLASDHFTRGQVITVEVRPFDGTAAGPSVTSNAVTVMNSLPVLTSVAVAPSGGGAPVRGTALVATAAGMADADGDAVTVQYEWKVNGTTVQGVTGNVLTGTNFSKGQVVTVTATPSDGLASGAPVTGNSVTIQNSAPAITGVSISPTSGGKGDTFTCTPSGWSDLDGDAEGYAYEWKAGSQVVGGGATLSGAGLTKGQALTCTATPADGTASGTPRTSTTVTVANTPPSLVAVTLSPANPLKSDTLTATPAGYADVDGDMAEYQYTWKRNGVAITGQTGPTLSGTFFAKGQVISVEVQPFDGTSAGTAVTSNTVTVVNSTPQLTSVTVAPSGGGSPVRGTALVATAAGMADADGDAVTIQYEWKVNGSTVQGATGNVLTGTNFSKGQVVTVTATPSDGLAYGSPVAGNSVTIQNSAPAFTGVSISPASGGKGDTFTCTPTGWSDLDGDAEGYTYEWKAGSQVVGGSATLSGAGLTKGQSLTCTVTPTDGAANGTSRTSTAAMLVNTPPSLVAVTLSPANPLKSDTLTATPTGYADVDGDMAEYHYTWKRNDVAITGQTGSTLSGAFFSKGQFISVEVRPFDGTAAGTAVTSNAVTVVNSPPQLASVTVAPSGGGTPIRGKALLATSAGVTDADGDLVTVRHEWTVGGQPVLGVSGSILPGTNFTRGQTATVVATPDDGSLSGTPVTGNTVTIQNAPPTAPSISVSPSAPGDTDDLVCSVTSLSTDADGDTLFYDFTWMKNGLPFSSTGSTSTSSTISAGSTSPFDTFSCIASAYDGTVSSPISSASVTVGGARSCKDLLDIAPGTPDGVYAIDPDGNGPIAPVNLYCNMTAGGWTLVANVYDSAGDDAPNSTNYVVSGWQQTGNGTWSGSASTVDRNSSGTGSAAVSLSFVAALKSGANQQNLQMCFILQDGTDSICRSSADGTLTLVSYPTGNPKLTTYSGNTLPYTYGRLAGLAGSSDGYNAANYTYGEFRVPRLRGSQYDFGDGDNNPPFNGSMSDIPDGHAFTGVWHASGGGKSYRPWFTNDRELSFLSSTPDPIGSPVGFRLYVGPEAPPLGSSTNPARSCQSILTNNASATNGKYWIDPDGTGPVAAANLYCDMSAGGWTLVANIYDSPWDDAPNSTDYVVSGWQQTGSGIWASSVSSVDRDSSGTGSAAVSLEFVAALKASAAQQNLKMCFVRQNGTDNLCKSSSEGSVTLTSYSTGNPKLTAYSGNNLLYTYGRMAGLAGSRDGYDYHLYESPGGAGTYGIPTTAGSISDWGVGGWLVEYASYSTFNYFGVWHGGGEGISYRPSLADDNELGNGWGSNPTPQTYGFRVYIGQ